MKLGVRLHDFGKSTPLELSKKAKEYNFKYVQLVLNKAFVDETGENLDKKYAKNISKLFKKQGIQIAMLGAYFNPVHSNKEKVKQCTTKFENHLKFAKYFNTQYVGTETGSCNDDKWTFNEKNLTEEKYQESKEVIKSLVKTAELNKSYVAVEGAFGHIMNNPIRLKRLLDEINSPNLKVTVDLYNYLSISNYKDQTKIFDECLELFKDKIVIFHLKDFIVDGDALKQVGLGKGILNYEYIIPKIEQNYPNAYCIFEGVMPVDMESSIKYLKEKGAKL